MGYWRDIAQEGGEKIIVFILIVFLLSLVGLTLVWSLISQILSAAFSVSIPMLKLGPVFTLLFFMMIVLLSFSFVVGDIRQKGVVGLIIYLAGLIALLLLAFYAPQWFPSIFEGAVVDMHSAVQSIIPIP